MSDKFFIRLFKNLNFILILTAVFFGTGSIALVFKWCKNANTFGDNILVEMFIGGLFAIVPVLFGIFIGRKSKELQFYSRIKNLLNTLKQHQESGDIKKEATRNIVMEFSDTLGEDILEEDWLKNVIRKDWVFDEKECGICGLPSETVNDRCKNCKLSCFAWQS